jgi:ADP-ribosyl-[dinitrogen reductase] hydrolase
MVGGGTFRVKPGEWTDDTAMAHALADSLHAKSELYPADLITRFVQWMDEGAYSCTGKCFDIGIATRQALNRWKTSGDPIAGSTDPNAAGNGSLIRLAPVAIRFFNDRAKLRDTAALQSKTTHAGKEAIDACVVYAEMLADAIEGKKRSEVLRSRDGTFTDAINKIVAGSWRAKPRPRINASGYVCHSLEAALCSVARSGTYKQAVLTAANLGDDANTTAAIAGQLAGALHGVTGMPRDWVDKVAWPPRIRGMASGLLERP